MWKLCPQTLLIKILFTQGEEAMPERRILQIGKVDVGNDTLFSRKVKLPVATDHLTLVISSGGSGVAAIKEAYRTAK